MNRAVLIGAVLLLALLAAFYYFVDIRGREAEAEEETAGRRLVADFDHQLVRRVSIEPVDGPVMRVKRASAEAGWRMELPLEADADPDVLRGLLETLGRLTVIEAPFPPGDDGLAAYGLDPPRLAVIVEGEGGVELARLHLGGPAPFGASRYAAVRDSGEVGLVSDAGTGAIPGAVFDLREKRLLRFRREEVREIRIETTGHPALVILRQGDNWEIVEPLSFAADRELTGNLLWELIECRALEFPGSGVAAGLDGDPACRIGLGLADGTVLEARFGDAAGAPGEVFAVGASGTVMTVESAVLDSARRPADQWREMRPFPRYVWEVDGLAVARAGSCPVTWRKGEDGTWRRDGHPPEAESAAETIDRALNLLTGLEACGLSGSSDGDREASALVEPEFTVTLDSGLEDDLTGETLEIWFTRGTLGSIPEGCGEAGALLCGIRPGGESIYMINEPGRDELRALLETLSGGDGQAGD